MRRILCWSLLAAAVAGFGLSDEALARSKAVEVSVTNYTAGQPFSPITCVVHDRTFSIYQLGQAAGAGLESIAEDAIADDLAEEVAQSNGAAKMLVVGDGPIPPGGTDSVVVEMDRRDLVSCVWMLVNTNDTFSSITGVERPRKRETFHFHRIAFDAGTEANDEQAEHIPGPCCGDMSRMGMDENGLVLGSPGIAGIGDLMHVHDWRGPVAAVVVRRP